MRAMILNFSKCSVVQFTKKRHIINIIYSLEAKDHLTATSYKYLRVLYRNNFPGVIILTMQQLRLAVSLNFLKRNFKQSRATLKETAFQTYTAYQDTDALLETNKNKYCRMKARPKTCSTFCLFEV